MKHPILLATGGCIAVLTVMFLVLLQIGMFGAHGFIWGMVWLLFQLSVTVFPAVLAWKARRQRRQAAIAARADYEHAALLRGDIRTGVYGQFQPKGL